MGVNRENEPLSGTGPDNRLFDKSLMTIVKRYKSNTHNNEKIGIRGNWILIFARIKSH